MLIFQNRQLFYSIIITKMINLSRLPHRLPHNRSKQTPTITPFIKESDNDACLPENRQNCSTHMNVIDSGRGKYESIEKKKHQNITGKAQIGRQDKKTAISWLTPTNAKNKKSIGITIASTRSEIQSSKWSIPSKSNDQVEQLLIKVNQLSQQNGLLQSKIDHLAHQCALLQHENQIISLSLEDSIQKQSEQSEIIQHLKSQLHALEIQLKRQKDKNLDYIVKSSQTSIQNEIISKNRSETVNIQDMRIVEIGMEAKTDVLPLEEKYKQIAHLFNFDLDSSFEHNHLVDRIQTTIKLFGQYALQTDSEIHSLFLKLNEAQSETLHLNHINQSLESQLIKTQQLLQIYNEQLTQGYLLKLQFKYQQKYDQQ